MLRSSSRAQQGMTKDSRYWIYKTNEISYGPILSYGLLSASSLLLRETRPSIPLGWA